MRCACVHHPFHTLGWVEKVKGRKWWMENGAGGVFCPSPPKTILPNWGESGEENFFIKWNLLVCLFYNFSILSWYKKGTVILFNHIFYYFIFFIFSIKYIGKKLKHFILFTFSIISTKHTQVHQHAWLIGVNQQMLCFPKFLLKEKIQMYLVDLEENFNGLIDYIKIL